MFINPISLNKMGKMAGEPQFKRDEQNYDLEFVIALKQPPLRQIKCQRAPYCDYVGYSVNCGDLNGNQHCSPEGVGAKRNTGYRPNSIEF